MSERHRVTTGAKSFDIERFVRLDKEGAEVWAKAAYCRNRRDLLISLRALGLSDDLARDVPAYHHDAYRSLSMATESARGMSEAQSAALEKAHAANRARRAAG